MDPNAQQRVERANTYATNNGRYNYSNFVGKGAFGAVLKASDQESSGAPAVAIKIVLAKKSLTQYLFRKTPAAGKAARQEANLLFDLRHQCIVAIRDHFEFKVSRREIGFAIVMDYCPGGNLETRLASLTARLCDKERFLWYQQLATALEYIHRRGVVHRDLKPANILIDDAENLIVADVGIAKALCENLTIGGPTEQKYMETVAGTQPYMAPEVWNEHYTTSSDVFSMALVMFVICERPHPLVPGVGAFRNPLGQVMYTNSRVRQEKATSKSLLDAHHCPKAEMDLFDSMLHFDYNYRPTAADVLKTVKAMEQKRLEEERRRREEEIRRMEAEKRRQEERERLRRESECARMREEERRREEQQGWWGWFQSWFA